ncbi:MAG: four helix bundle protein [Crocosphaera sp.]|nr:four helix bundle protein [Crocosphaera sp.]
MKEEEKVVERGFETLDFYQDSKILLKASYKLAEGLPNYERYNLSDQLRRASTSILLNIAEGYGRYHYLDRLRFFYIRPLAKVFRGRIRSYSFFA